MLFLPNCENPGLTLLLHLAETGAEVFDPLLGARRVILESEPRLAGGL